MQSLLGFIDHLSPNNGHALAALAGGHFQNRTSTATKRFTDDNIAVIDQTKYQDLHTTAQRGYCNLPCSITEGAICTFGRHVIISSNSHNCLQQH